MLSLGFTVSYLAHYETLLQNTTNIIAKCDCYFITKYDKSLLLDASGFLLQNGRVQNYYKDEYLLQNVAVLFQNATFIIEVNVSFKMGRYTPVSDF